MSVFVCVCHTRCYYTTFPERYRGGFFSGLLVQKSGSRTFKKCTVNYRSVRVTDPQR